MTVTKTENGYLVVQKHKNGQSESRGQDRWETIEDAITSVFENLPESTKE